MADTVQLFNPNDGITGRDGGPYLDVEQAKRDEDVRAAKEDREPDYENMSANAGIPLQTAREQLASVNVNNLPSMDGAPVANTLMGSAVDNDELPIQAWAEVEVPDDENEVEVGVLKSPDSLADQPNVGDDEVNPLDTDDDVDVAERQRAENEREGTYSTTDTGENPNSGSLKNESTNTPSDVDGESGTSETDSNLPPLTKY